jgi:hypothetical protein
VPPTFIELRLARLKLPTSGWFDTRFVVDPLHEYVYAGAVPLSVHDDAHESTVMWRPFVESLSRRVLEPTEVSRLIAPMPVTPLEGPTRSTARSTTSPGTSPVAFVVRRFVEPRAIWTVPAETVWF